MAEIGNKFFRDCEKEILKIRKNLKNNQIDWTIQVSKSSLRPESVAYSAQIEAPANGLQPLTWVKDSADELYNALKETAEKGVNAIDVERAWHETEIKRAEQLIKAHKMKIAEIDDEKKSGE